ncbi:MAG: ROK family protein [Promethearchaeota archaeon]
MSLKFLVGVDIGGTSVRVGLAPVAKDLDSGAIKKCKVDTPKEDNLAISRVVSGQIRELIEGNGAVIDAIESISIATAGPIDKERGEVFNNANLGFKTIPLKEPISKDFNGIPIHLINDCNGAVLGVHYFEALPEEKNNMAYVTISTGIGGGIILNNRLLLGKEGNAAEVGHGILNPVSGVTCNCGSEGCWEAFSSGTAIARHAKDALKANPRSGDVLRKIVNGNLNNIDAKSVFKAAREGDKIAIKLVKQANEYSAIGIGLMNNFYDLSVVYLGGSMLKDQDQILPYLQDSFLKDPLHYTINKPPAIKRSTLGDEVGLLGALALGKYKLDNNRIIS